MHGNGCPLEKAGKFTEIPYFHLFRYDFLVQITCNFKYTRYSSMAPWTSRLQYFNFILKAYFGVRSWMFCIACICCFGITYFFLFRYHLKGMNKYRLQTIKQNTEN